MNLHENQRKSIIVLREEIKWLLKDEIATALLDIDSVTSNTLNLVMKHIAESKGRSSCIMEVIHLNFVFDSNESHEKFVEEFVKIKVPSYKLLKEDDLYYLTKDNTSFDKENFIEDRVFDFCGLSRRYNDFDKDFDDVASQPSDISSSGSVLGTDGTGI